MILFVLQIPLLNVWWRDQHQNRAVTQEGSCRQCCQKDTKAMTPRTTAAGKSRKMCSHGKVIKVIWREYLPPIQKISFVKETKETSQLKAGWHSAFRHIWLDCPSSQPKGSFMCIIRLRRLTTQEPPFQYFQELFLLSRSMFLMDTGSVSGILRYSYKTRKHMFGKTLTDATWMTKQFMTAPSAPAVRWPMEG